MSYWILGSADFIPAGKDTCMSLETYGQSCSPLRPHSKTKEVKLNWCNDWCLVFFYLPDGTSFSLIRTDNFFFTSNRILKLFRVLNSINTRLLNTLFLLKIFKEFSVGIYNRFLLVRDSVVSITISQHFRFITFLLFFE